MQLVNNNSVNVEKKG